MSQCPPSIIIKIHKIKKKDAKENSKNSRMPMPMKKPMKTLAHDQKRILKKSIQNWLPLFANPIL
jgi:hypothetical protein